MPIMFRPLLISLCLTSTALATTWTVDDDGKADFDNIQAAVDAASDGDEIIVMPGTYTSTTDEVVDMRGKEIHLHSSNGAEVTIIDGEDTRRGIVCFTNETSGTVIEGFTITRGSMVNLLRGSFNNGAGMLCYFSSPVLTNCVFTENNTIASGHNGGGLAIHGGSPSLTDCVIDGNNSYQAGGGIYTREGSSFSLTNCTITNNTTGSIGGGIFNVDSIAKLQDTVVCGNTPDQIYGSWTDGGGNTVADTCSGDPTGACCVGTSCSIGTAANCSAAGGTYLGDGSSCSGDPCGAGSNVWTVDDSGGADFYDIQSAVNAALDGDEILVYPGTYTSTGDNVVDIMGKAVWLHSSDGPETTILDGEGVRRGILYYSGETSKTIIEGFTITNGYTSGDGGGMYNYESSPTLTYCIFENNTALNGGGMCNEYGNPTLTDCTFTNNTAGVWGGGMHNRSSSATPTLTYCIFENNYAGERGGGMANQYNYDSSATLTNCTFTGNNSARWGGGIYNFDSSPMLTDCTFTGNTANYDGGGMRNYGSSPTLTNCTFTNNTTDGFGGGMANTSINSPTLTDTVVCGNTPDQIDGDWIDNGGNTVEDECPPDCPDINGDGNVDVGDLLSIIDQWGLTNSPADVNQDGIVDVSDLLIVVGNWGPCE